jgi:hypothetical protein
MKGWSFCIIAGATRDSTEISQGPFLAAVIELAHQAVLDSHFGEHRAEQVGGVCLRGVFHRIQFQSVVYHAHGFGHEQFHHPGIGCGPGTGPTLEIGIFREVVA